MHLTTSSLYCVLLLLGKCSYFVSSWMGGGGVADGKQYMLWCSVDCGMLLYNITYLLFNSFGAIAPFMGQKKGSFFTGVYLPQKLVLSPPIEIQYCSV
jgi:hypothetical protein